jgi:hypothetical protein
MSNTIPPPKTKQQELEELLSRARELVEQVTGKTTGLALSVFVEEEPFYALAERVPELYTPRGFVADGKWIPEISLTSDEEYFYLLQINPDID